MYAAFLRLLGIRPIEEGSIDRWGIYFTNLKTPFQKLLFFLVAAAAAYVVWWFYQREPDYCPLKKRRFMAGLRFAGVAVLLFILSGPVLEVFLRGYVKGKVVILVDSSKSMSRVDKYTRPEDKLVAAHALGRIPLKETDPRKVDGASEQAIAGATRMDLLRGIFRDPETRFLEKLQERFDVEMLSFSRAADMKPIEPGAPKGAGAERKLDASSLDGIQADGLVTEIGGAIRSTMNRLKGHALSAIILVTDGGNNKGEEPAVVAQDAPARIYPIGIGVPEARDVSLAHMYMESKVFVDDLAPIYVRVRQHGFNGEQAELVVTANGDEIGRQPVTLRDSGEQNETLRVKPKKPGQYTYRVEVRLLNLASEDSEPGNNAKSRDIEVIDQKLKVLVLEADPRWEYRYLKNSLLRDKRVDCKILLRVPDMAELAKGSNVYLPTFPPPAELAKYHVIVFGNMPNDGFFTDFDIENLRKFVIEEGGGIWFIAGKNNLPDSYKDSKLEMLLPVEFEANATVSGEDEQLNPITEGFRPVLSPEGRGHSVTRLALPEGGASDGGEDHNAALWETVPEMYWHHKATRAKLGAATLLVAGSEKGNAAAQRGGPPPLLVTWQVGRGRVLYQGFADLWRMRYPSELGPDALERLHGHTVQYLGLAKLLGRSDRAEIITDKEEYAVGDRIKINARVREKNFELSSADHVTAIVADRENEANQVTVDLTPEPGQAGSFRGEVPASADGKFRVTLRDFDDAQAHADIAVTIPQLEMETPDLKKELLDNVAKASVKSGEREGKVGMYYADQAGQLLKDLSQAQRVIEEKKENTLWDAPILLVLFTACMGLEWLIRKRSDLL